MTVPTTISSIDDPRVAAYRGVRDATLRAGGRRGGTCIAESELVIRRLLDSDAWSRRVRSLLLSHQRFESLGDVVERRLDPDIPVYVAADAVVNEIAGYTHHRGAIAAMARPPTNALQVEAACEGLHRTDRPCAIILGEGVTNVDNIGTIFRNAAAFGASAVVLRDGCADPLFRKAIRISMGHVFSVPWATSRDWAFDIEHLRTAWNVAVIAAELGPGSRPLSEMPFVARVAFVFGAERSGVTRATLDQCDGVFRIPMADNATALNVGVASAVFLWEWARIAGVRSADAADGPGSTA